MKKIKQKKKEYSEMDYMERARREIEIQNTLNGCFEKESLDLHDRRTILEWACWSVPTTDLVYMLEKIKFDLFKDR